MVRRNHMALNLRKSLYGHGVVFAFLLGLAGCKDLGAEPQMALLPPPERATVSFLHDVRPIFADTRVGCLGCHGGTNNLFVGTQPDLLRGGLHGPAVVPGNVDGKESNRRAAR